MRRRFKPYSQTETLLERKNERKRLIQDVLILGILFGIVAEFITSLLNDLLALASPGIEVNIILRVVILLLVGSIGWYVILNRRVLPGEKLERSVNIGVAVRYVASKSHGVEILPQAREDGMELYQVLRLASDHYQRAYSSGGDKARNLYKEWQSLKSEGRTFTQFSRQIHGELLDVIFLDFLHKYGKDSLGAKARYSVKQVDLEAQKVPLADLPALISPASNRYVHKWLGSNSNWVLEFPAGTQLEVVSGDDLRIWTMTHPRYGYLKLTIHHVPWFGPANNGEYRYIDVNTSTEYQVEDYVVIGNRIDIETSFNVNYDGIEGFESWANGLIATLEEQFDWDYYLERYHTNLMFVLYKNRS